MALHIVEIHPAEDSGVLNREWFVLENGGDKPFSTRNCTLSVSRRGQRKKKALGTIDPGFVLGPGERIRVLTGHPGRKAHGEPPEDELKNYHLFLNESVVRGAGVVLTLALRSLPVAEATFDAATESGVAATTQ
ncbi:MAG: hypothetical protein Tsb0020_24990 [Haliangiales bacterium]